MRYIVNSLVFLLIAFTNFYVMALNSDSFIYPKAKPYKIQNIQTKDKTILKKLVPLKKPVIKKIKTIESVKSKFIIPKNKPNKIKINTQNSNLVKKKENKIFTTKEIIKKEIKLENTSNKKEKNKTKINIQVNKKNLKKVSDFVYPEKKPVSYKLVKEKNIKSNILSVKDFEKAKIVFKFIKEKKWNSALKTAEKVKDKEFKSLINWMYLKTTGNLATFNDYQNFINLNSDYPRIGRLQYLAEHKINLKNHSPAAIINYFDKKPPVSGMGKIKLAEAYLIQNNVEKIPSLIKEGWTNAELSKADLRYYRNKFKKYLSSQDHIDRASYLAWNSKYWDLKRMLRYLPKEEKALYNARQILMSNSYGVDKSISAVPLRLKNNIGLEYDRLKWRNRRGRLDDSIELLNSHSNKSEDQLVRADLWWKQRESIVRTLIYKKRYDTAYKVASEHSMNYGPEYAEAEWLAGWISLSFLKSPEYSIKHFENFYLNVGYPISRARGAYWIGRAYKTLGDQINSKKYFEEGSVFLTTYYGQLSFKELNSNSSFTLKDDGKYEKEFEKEFYNNKLIRHVKLLKELDSIKYGKDIIKHLASIDIDKGSEVLAAKFATEMERYDYAIQISKQASYQKRFHNQYNYPIISTPRTINNKTMPNPELILAIIRQESEFDRRANSYVGARGMMQLMKPTAKIVAKRAKLPYSISGLTKDPEYNIKLGSYYFSSLLDNYDGVYPFAIAAYNAGPNRVKTWRKINKDPSKNQIDFVDWIELIRFKETRNYVQRVLENSIVYKYMLTKKPVTIDSYFR